MSPLMFFATATGAESAASALQTAITMESVWGAINPFIPIIVTVSLIALTIGVVRGIVKRVRKGKLA